MAWEFLPSAPELAERTGLAERVASMARRVGSTRKQSKVLFKDLSLDMDEDPVQPSLLGRTPSMTPRKDTQKTKLVVIMVGLPGRGKTFLCNKLKCYLNWLGHKTQQFNVGAYRHLMRDSNTVQDASFFDPENQAGAEAREKALNQAFNDLQQYLEKDEGQIAILDATNSTKERRSSLIDKLHGKFKYLFIESVCSDPKVLDQNYLQIVKHSPDYKGVEVQQALEDFKARVAKYEKVQSPISDPKLHYIKLNNMITGRGSMELNLISGYLPSKIVFFLMQVCKAGLNQSLRRIWLTRHGESLANVKGWIGTDLGLSEKGQRYADRLPYVLMDRVEQLAATEEEYADELEKFGVEAPELDQPAVSVWTSTLQRAIHTANMLPYPKMRWKALDEIDAGKCDGMTYEEIGEKYPDIAEARKKDKLKYRYPYGESYMDLVQRLEPVILEIERSAENVCIVAHQAILRVIMGYFTAAHLEDIPHQEVPQHTLIELQPRHDGIMHKILFPVDVKTASRRNTAEQAEVQQAAAEAAIAEEKAKFPVAALYFTHPAPSPFAADAEQPPPS